MTVLSYFFGIKMDFGINDPGHGNNVFSVINATKNVI